MRKISYIVAIRQLLKCEMLIRNLPLLLLLMMPTTLLAMHEPWTTTVYPQDEDKLWWDEDWWQEGQLDRPDNYEVSMQEISYSNGDVDIPAYLFRPSKPGNYPAVLFQHGRRGIDDLTILMPRRLAARGFVVLAPDLWSGRFLDSYPMGHDAVLNEDVARGIETLLALPGIEGDRACVVSHTRGGYMTLMALVEHNKQNEGVSCYVSSYPTWQDPNQPEPMQVYQYAPQINELQVPVLVFMGEHEQYQRLRPIMEGISELKRQNRKPQLIVYPGVGRGFDFRPPSVRTFADDLATKDALRRTELFIRRHLQ